MRPRLFTAEDSHNVLFYFSNLHRFNEAAAIHRGRPEMRLNGGKEMTRLQ